MKKRIINWSGRGHNYTPEEIQTVVEVMGTADPLTQGRYLNLFEEKFKSFLGGRHSFAVSNCTNALELCAILSGIGPGDEVIIPAHTFCATAIPFARTGAVIKWADIDPATFVVNTQSIEALISARTKVIIVVHLYGLMAPMNEILELAEKNDILLVEDCAQSLGAEINSHKAGTFGDFACFSFHGAKNANTLGEGGMLSLKSEEHAELIPGLRHNGICPYENEREFYWKPAMSNVAVDIQSVWPHNFCLGEVQCALGSKLMDRIDSMIEERQARFRKFKAAMKGHSELVFQNIPEDYKHAHHLLVARYKSGAGIASRDDFINRMWNEHQVKVIVQYYPLYRYPLFKENGLGKADCPETDLFFDHMVSFPFHLWMSEDDFEYMIEVTLESLKSLGG
jgi:perosamine synthetase